MIEDELFGIQESPENVFEDVALLVGCFSCVDRGEEFLVFLGGGGAGKGL